MLFSPPPTPDPASISVLQWLGGEQLNRAVDTGLKVVFAVVGLWWFSRRSIHLPRLNLEQEVSIHRFQEEQEEVLIAKALLIINNVGEVPFCLKKISVAAIQTLPLPERIRQEISDSGCIIDESIRDGLHSAWTGLAESTVSGGKDWTIEVRPHEIEIIPITLRIRDSGVQCMTVITQLWQTRKLWYFWKTALTWRVQTLVDLQKGTEMLVQESSDGNKQSLTVPSRSAKDAVKSGTPIIVKVPGGGGKK